ncbi:MAG: alpha/beta fold hydrolase [Acidobacteria bacterium]|nr:MAG: alpha/beta fold hydrolase [Acidobacteriota bacterium]
MPNPGRPAQTLEGLWQGTLDVGGTTLRLVLNISTAPDGRLIGHLDSLDQGAMNLPIDRITFDGKRVRLEMKGLNAAYEGRLSEDGSDISGQWTQGGISLPLTFRRTDEAPTLRRPQEPKKPYPYSEEEVIYENRRAGVKLAGTLTLPRSPGPFPAVLLITGSGPQDRNETVAGHRPFLVLADYLTRRGIAVLRVDDRGVGGSTGSVTDATSQDFAEDVLAGVAYLKRRPEIDPEQIGLIGHSEGGLIAPLAAIRSSDIAFIILMSAPGLPGEDILLLQAAAIAKASGASDDVIAINRAIQKRIFDMVKRSEADRLTEERLREDVMAFIAQLPEEQKNIARRFTATLNRQIKMVLTPWFRFFLTYDPRPTLKKVTCPVLVISGERDLQVPPRENLPAIVEALEGGGNSDYQVVKLPGLNHLLQRCQTGLPAEYAKIEETINPVVLEIIADWILRHARRQ